jgi:hypothetical protein
LLWLYIIAAGKLSHCMQHCMHALTQTALLYISDAQ